MQAGFPLKEQERSSDLCVALRPCGQKQKGIAISPLVLRQVPKWPNSGPRLGGTSNRGKHPRPELQGALELGGSQVGVRAVAAERTLLPSDASLQ